MAKYGGNYKCGCRGEVQVVGPIKDREWKVDRHFDRLCAECFKAKMISESSSKANEMGLIELEGTQKQIDWALQIRNKFINDIDDRFAEIDQNSSKLDANRGITVEGLKQTFIYIYETIKLAEFWINNRHDLNHENGSTAWKLIAEYYSEANTNLDKKN